MNDEQWLSDLIVVLTRKGLNQILNDISSMTEKEQRDLHRHYVERQGE